MGPGFEARVADILRADEVEGTDAFKRKLLLLEYLVENELRFDREPAFVYLLIAFYKEDPRCMGPLRAVSMLSLFDVLISKLFDGVPATDSHLL